MASREAGKPSPGPGPRDRPRTGDRAPARGVDVKPRSAEVTGPGSDPGIRDLGI